MVPVRPGYTGHRYDEEADLIDMVGRAYDHETRRFLTPDPFIQAPLFSQSHNRYAYVWNNPATLVDPTGFEVKNTDADICRRCPGEGGEGPAQTPSEDGNPIVGAAMAGAYILYAGGGWLIKQLSGGGDDEAPNSDDNNLTDGQSTGSGGGGSSANPVVRVWNQIGDAPWLSRPTSTWTMPQWISDLNRSTMRVAFNWANAGGAAGAGFSTWAGAANNVTGLAIGLDRIAGSVPFGGPLYYAAQGRWQEASDAAILDLIAVGTGRVLAARRALGDGVGAMRRLRYERAPYHGRVASGVKSRGPTNGQAALDNSLQVTDTSTRRVGIDPDTREFVIFDRTSDGVFHGHVRAWGDLRPVDRAVLREEFGVSRSGKVPW
jgi:RHS repeat-associated protein